MKKHNSMIPPGDSHTISNNGVSDLVLVLIAVILLTTSVILLKQSYENLFRKPAPVDEIYPGGDIACLRDLYNDPVYKCKAQCPGTPDGLFQDQKEPSKTFII